MTSLELEVITGIPETLDIPIMACNFIAVRNSKLISMK
jgi:hypothetical protein